MKRFVVGLLLVVMALVLCSCAAPEKAIVGTWKNQTTVLGVVKEVTYTFNEDGTGVKSNLMNVNFTYSFENEKLLITTSILGIENTEEFSFDFNGDKLVLTSEKETILLEKVK